MYSRRVRQKFSDWIKICLTRILYNLILYNLSTSMYLTCVHLTLMENSALRIVLEVLLTDEIQLIGSLSASRIDSRYMKHHTRVAMKAVTVTNRNQWVPLTSAGEAHAIHIIPRP